MSMAWRQLGAVDIQIASSNLKFRNIATLIEVRTEPSSSERGALENVGIAVDANAPRRRREVDLLCHPASPPCLSSHAASVINRPRMELVARPIVPAMTLIDMPERRISTIC
jgi:hypothetical protein